MDEEFNKHKSLIHELVDEYSICPDTAKEYLEQMLHAYLHLNPDATFKTFFDLITSILVTLFN